MKKILFNKYLLSFLFFIAWMFFFERNDFVHQFEKKKELESIKGKILFYKEEIQKTRSQIKDLQTNSKALEKFAREKYFMKKINEDVFIVDSALLQ